MEIAAASPSSCGTTGPGISRCYRRESLRLMTFAVAGMLFQLAGGLVSGWQFRTVDIVRGTLLMLVTTGVLLGVLPLAVKLSHNLGLPGAPLLAAKSLPGESRYSLRNTVRDGVSWSFATMAAGAVAQILWEALGFSLARPSTPAAMRVSPTLSQMIKWWTVGGLLSGLGAGIREEILYRLVLTTFLTWLAVRFWPSAETHPTRGQLWSATVLQGYIFGLMHLIPPGFFGGAFRVNARVLLEAFVLNQTWTGVIFGRLYLRSGLEAAVVAHVVLDVTMVLGMAALIAIARHFGFGS